MPTELQHAPAFDVEHAEDHELINELSKAVTGRQAHWRIILHKLKMPGVLPEAAQAVRAAFKDVPFEKAANFGLIPKVPDGKAKDSDLLDNVAELGNNEQRLRQTRSAAESAELKTVLDAIIRFTTNIGTILGSLAVKHSENPAATLDNFQLKAQMFERERLALEEIGRRATEAASKAKAVVGNGHHSVLDSPAAPVLPKPKTKPAPKAKVVPPPLVEQPVKDVLEPAAPPAKTGTITVPAAEAGLAGDPWEHVRKTLTKVPDTLKEGLDSVRKAWRMNSAFRAAYNFHLIPIEPNLDAKDADFLDAVIRIAQNEAVMREEFSTTRSSDRRKVANKMIGAVNAAKDALLPLAAYFAGEESTKASVLAAQHPIEVGEEAREAQAINGTTHTDSGAAMLALLQRELKKESPKDLPAAPVPVQKKREPKVPKAKAASPVPVAIEPVEEKLATSPAKVVAELVSPEAAVVADDLIAEKPAAPTAPLAADETILVLGDQPTREELAENIMGPELRVALQQAMETVDGTDDGVQIERRDPELTARLDREAETSTDVLSAEGPLPSSNPWKKPRPAPVSRPIAEIYNEDGNEKGAKPKLVIQTMRPESIKTQELHIPAPVPVHVPVKKPFVPKVAEDEDEEDKEEEEKKNPKKAAAKAKRGAETPVVEETEEVKPAIAPVRSEAQKTISLDALKFTESARRAQAGDKVRNTLAMLIEKTPSIQEVLMAVTDEKAGKKKNQGEEDERRKTLVKELGLCFRGWQKAKMDMLTLPTDDPAREEAEEILELVDSIQEFLHDIPKGEQVIVGSNPADTHARNSTLKKLHDKVPAKISNQIAELMEELAPANGALVKMQDSIKQNGSGIIQNSIGNFSALDLHIRQAVWAKLQTAYLQYDPSMGSIHEYMKKELFAAAEKAFKDGPPKKEKNRK